MDVNVKVAESATLIPISNGHILTIGSHPRQCRLSTLFNNVTQFASQCQLASSRVRLNFNEQNRATTDARVRKSRNYTRLLDAVAYLQLLQRLA